MTNAFSTAMDALFADANMAADAYWIPRGVGAASAIRVIRSRPDAVTDWGGGQFVQDADLVEIRVSDAPRLAEGDLVQIDGSRFRVSAAPRQDAEQLVWIAELSPA